MKQGVVQGRRCRIYRVAQKSKPL